MDLLPGTEVIARGLRWEVVASESLGPQTLFRLRGLDGGVRGFEFDLLHPFEAIEPRPAELRPEKAGPLPNWLVFHQAFLLEQALGPQALLAAQPGRLRIEPYQLVPVVRAIRMPRVRLLLADGVGLGKTIQAGLVITEMIARRLAHRILVVSPAGPLLEQWKSELLERFGLRMTVVDRGQLEETRRGTELGANPFDHLPLALASVDFLKQERILDLLERCTYDVVVIDEAHHAMDSGAMAEREDNQRRRLAQVLSRKTDSLLLLTATPHDGHDRSFASLCELLDPSLVDGRGVLRGEAFRAHVVRRLKRHIKDPATGKPLFQDRVVEPCPVDPDPEHRPAFAALHRAMVELIAPELRRAFRAKSYSDVLAFLALLKRSVSTVAACRSTLAVVRDRFRGLVAGAEETEIGRRQRLRSLKEGQRKLALFGTTSLEEEQEQAQLEAEDLAQQLARLEREVRSGKQKLKRARSVTDALTELEHLAETAEGQDPKLSRLAEVIQKIRAQEKDANVLVYTEYVDSQKAAVAALEKAGLGTILTLSGDPEIDRTGITERFQNESGLILVSTDTAAEGLNLQQRCHHLIHLELPFNPNRLEQRNGRIDRYGQTKPPLVWYLFLKGTFEARILMRLIVKYERQRSRLKFMPNTLGLTAATDATSERLLRGLMDEDTRLFEEGEYLFTSEGQDEAAGADEATRELLEEIDRSLSNFERAARSFTWLGDEGLSAEESVLREAGAARQRGCTYGAVDLAAFVRDAVLLDGGQVQGDPGQPVFTLHLPQEWCHDLKGFPGCDSTTRQARLTTRLEVERDDNGNRVGFLGRAHPLVRRALDRVRHLAFVQGQGKDPRVTAVSWPGLKPALLFTYLGRIASGAGRELEQVFAVKVEQEKPGEVIFDPGQWIALAQQPRALRAGGVWESHFASWAHGMAEEAQKTAASAFQPLTKTFLEDYRNTLDAEERSLTDWLEQRAEEIAPKLESRQAGLFEAPREDAPSGPRTPQQRLAALATDRTQHPARRSEAEAVLRLAEQRQAALAARRAIRDPEIVPLGLLMLVPAGGR